MDVKRQHLEDPASDEIDPAVQSRIEKFPKDAVCKGERFLSIHYKRQERTDTCQPLFTHQIFENSLVCGYTNLRVNLTFDSRDWRVLDVNEQFDQTVENAEMSALDTMKGKVCIEPFFNHQTASIIDSFPGRIAWHDEKGYVLRWNESLNEECKTILRRGLAMSVFFIETASQVDVDNEGFKLLLLSERQGTNEYLIGFTLVYEFRNPIRGTRSLRVCVMLVIPSHQRMGFGECMLNAIYTEAFNSDDITEVTVENPCEAFNQMRRRLDLKNCKRKGIFFNLDLEALEQYPSVLSPSTIQQIQPQLKLSEGQIQFCFECALFFKLKQAGFDAEDHERKSKFRLRIKDRIQKRPGDRIIPDKKSYLQEFKAVLQEEYLKELHSFEIAVSSLLKDQA